jgi:hypothetical protein
MIRHWQRFLIWTALVPVLGGCEAREPVLDLNDLTPAERRYIDRFVILERARAVALAAPERGEALLDSLAAAWGDSAAAAARTDLPTDPLRAAALQDLLRRILEAEADSLILAPRADRLTAPLPTPAAPAAPATRTG